MNKQQISAAALKARQFFDRGNTLSLNNRVQSLRKLGQEIRRRTPDLLAALQTDLNKCPYESFMAEIGLVLGEIDLACRKLKRWAKAELRRPSLAQMPATAKVMKQPYGVVLLMSPWNYPFQLTMIPLVSAVAAGNCALVKPSAYVPATAAMIKALCESVFESGHVQVILGGREENQALLEERYDYIFFTGSPGVGKLVMQKAAVHLTPLTLELGGKSPVLVDNSADLTLTARRILFGKLLNAGQTCVAPDYVLVQRSVKDGLVDAFKAELRRMLPDDNYLRTAYPRIINQKHFDRLRGLLEGQRLLVGGQVLEDSMQITPALVDQPAADSPLMQEEIFGPILPILAVQDMEEAVAFVRSRPHPLALYLFTRSKQTEDQVLGRLSFGGGCVNDTVLHLAGAHLPFGGVGESGMGHYHGKAGFDTFTHHRSVLKKARLFDLPLRYHPYKDPMRILPAWLLKH